MSHTPRPRRDRRGQAPKARTIIAATCPVHGRVELNANAVTLNVARETYQFMCDGCGPVVVHTIRATMPVRVMLHSGGVPYVPRGVDDDTTIQALGAAVFAPDPVPSWDEAEARYGGLA